MLALLCCPAAAAEVTLGFTAPAAAGTAGAEGAEVASHVVINAPAMNARAKSVSRCLECSSAWSTGGDVWVTLHPVGPTLQQHKYCKRKSTLPLPLNHTWEPLAQAVQTGRTRNVHALPRYRSTAKALQGVTTGHQQTIYATIAPCTSPPGDQHPQGTDSRQDSVTNSLPREGAQLSRPRSLRLKTMIACQEVLCWTY